MFQEIFEEQVISRRQGEFARLRRLREERLREERAMRSLDRQIRRKKEYFRRQEEARLLKIKEEEEARKREGVYFLSLLSLCRFFEAFVDVIGLE